MMKGPTTRFLKVTWWSFIYWSSAVPLYFHPRNFFCCFRDLQVGRRKMNNIVIIKLVSRKYKSFFNFLWFYLILETFESSLELSSEQWNNFFVDEQIIIRKSSHTRPKYQFDSKYPWTLLPCIGSNESFDIIKWQFKSQPTRL